ncbi:MAG: hypothetical protein JO304_26000 [Solirubrobacterales bacterium]|nr:hypothetical protein [Solirubrobacterales bacterium]MBV9002535.1 hypothetical protein [Solirubrobacterales bacterium]
MPVTCQQPRHWIVANRLAPGRARALVPAASVGILHDMRLEVIRVGRVAARRRRP